MIIWTPVLSVLYACVSYFCSCACSAQLSMFHMERRSRNSLIIIVGKQAYTHCKLYLHIHTVCLSTHTQALPCWSSG